MARKLCVHIGTGKTGSTAIQAFCSAQRAALRQCGVHYWGLNLEGCGAVDPFAWQSSGGTAKLQQLSEPEASRQLRQALSDALERLPDGATAFWSNESIYERPNVYIPLLKAAATASDLELLVIAYARNHTGYVRSAYKQWGIKHKTYRGQLLGFREWLTTRKDFLSYGKRLALWDAAFTDRFRLVNYNRSGDVVAHFCQFLPSAVAQLQPEPDLQVNASPPDQLLTLQAIFNNQFQEPVSPQAFQALRRRQPLLQRLRAAAGPPLRQLFPTDADLRYAQELLADDADLVNTILRRHGQPPLEADTKAPPAPDADQLASSLLAQLMAVVVQQDGRITELEQQLAATGKPLTASPNP